MEKNVKISMLNEIYGKLLTTKQYEIIDNYYNQDLSLSEIAENNQITRQAVRDILQKGEKKLLEYETKLLLMKRMLQEEKTIKKVLEEIAQIQDNDIDKKTEQLLKNITKEIRSLK